MEEKGIDRFYHEHPLVLTENVSDNNSLDCYGCGDLVTDLESAYVCTVQNCSNRIILHKKCGDLPSQILHPKHPQHPIHLYDYSHISVTGCCDICSRNMDGALGYRCSSCDFDVDLTCPIISIDSIIQGKIELHHPSHPQHPLTLMRKPLFSFYCDACGTQDVDMAYICSICEFMIHMACASLPLILPKDRHHRHHHHLSLAFTFPEEHKKYISHCDVCHKRLATAWWVYFCGDCRFFAHLRCVAFTTAETTKQDSNLEEEDANLIEFPLHARDISKELITPFVMRENGLNKFPDVKDMPSTVTMPQTTASFSFLFNYHNHPLSLVAEHHDDNKIMHEEEEEDEDEETNDELKVCDVCVSPISSSPYYECAPCKYFIHAICYLLPKTFSSSSSPNIYGECTKTHDKNHKFTLYTSSELLDMNKSLCKCEVCGLITNGRVYECEGCEMKIDVKCASLPTSIRHAFHAYHKQLVLNRRPSEGGKRKYIVGCGWVTEKFTYCCSSEDCDFELDLTRAVLPASITRREWDKYHSLMLLSDAALDHPSGFICDLCEVGLHPKGWMYHCRQCDLSFHLRCLRSASGWFRNIKFGRRFMMRGIHPNHPLTFSCVSIKRRCDLCSMEVYDNCGLECASCYFVVCLSCGRRELAKKM